MIEDATSSLSAGTYTPTAFRRLIQERSLLVSVIAVSLNPHSKLERCTK